MKNFFKWLIVFSAAAVSNAMINVKFYNRPMEMDYIIITALIVLSASAVATFIFSNRKAKA
ncbi:MAG: hypothetical protein ACO1N4_08590 [Pedobacter sp.]